MANTPYAAGSFSAASGGTLTPTVALTSDIGSGDNVYVGILSSSATAPTVTDTQAQEYDLITSETVNADCSLYVFACLNSGFLDHTVDSILPTFPGASNQDVLVVGDDGAQGVIDISVINAATTGTTASKATGTLGFTEEHVIAFVGSLGTSNPSFAAPFNNAVGVVSTGNFRLAAGYDIVSATTSVTASATVTSAHWSVVVISAPAAAVTPSLTLSNGVKGEAYSQTLEATGGIAPFTWSIPTGSLPTGLTMASGVISGTPSVSGTFTFVTRATDAHGVTGDATQTITILPGGAGGAPVTMVPNNMLAGADSDFESGTLSWAADTNAGTPTTVTTVSLTGTHSLKWSSLADGLTQISTGFINVKPNKGYSCAALVLPCGLTDCFIGIEWYTSGGTLIRTDLGADETESATPNGVSWIPLTGAFTSPSNAAKCKLTVQVQESNKGDVNHIDMAWLQQTNAQVLVDWTNSTFNPEGGAGSAFQDVTPWVRMDSGNGINYTRGRQDAISEIQPGSATFILENDAGMFTRKNANTIITLLGGQVSLQARCQVNLTDENGVWYTRFDGPIAEIDYVFDNTGNTSQANVTVSDVMAFMNRQDDLKCWTKEIVFSDQPILHWTLDDAGNAGGQGLAAETSGTNGPPMRPWNSDTSNVATIGWQDQTGGVETLADAVNPAALFDGSEAWSAGSNQPNNPVRGLDTGAVGPYSTPLGSPYFTPVLTAQSNPNWFVGNTGYQLNVTLPTEITPNVSDGTQDYTFECWFTMDPHLAGNLTQNVGPYVAFSLGSSRTNRCLLAGVYITGGSPMSFQVNTYDQPPAFLGKNYPGTAPPAVVHSVTQDFGPDGVPLPHHLAITIQGDEVSPTVTPYLDGVAMGSFTLSTKIAYDTLCIGGAYGGTGCWFGSVSLVSVYDYMLSLTQINFHTMLGQYGMWEQTADDTIAVIAQLANIPQFWNNTQATESALTLCDYQDISATNALAAMQLYEQAEQGLLYVDAKGTLNFQTRDQRMGKGAPDLLLPPDTFDSTMGYEIIDSYQINEQAVASQIFQSGGAYVNQASQDLYGVYATNTAEAPLQLPLITWSRAYGQLGLTSFYYWADPNLTDYSAWIANSRADPWLVPGQLTIDMLAPSVQGNLHISDYYKLDIGSLVAPTGTLPASFPDANFSMEWFIEGISETITQDQRQIQFYTSPAETQRAWRPADATYGVLGSTTRVGISESDTRVVQADGKDVAHDAGPPYWPPAFVSGTTEWSFETGTQSWTANNATVAQDSSVFATDGTHSLKITSTGAGSFWQGVSPAIPVFPGFFISASADIFVPQALGAVNVIINWHDSTDTFISSTSGTAQAMSAGGTNTFSISGTAPIGAFNAHIVVVDQETSTAGKIIYADNVVAASGAMNNPADDGHAFIGAADMRGITENLKAQLKPPICVVSAISEIQSQANGVLTQPQMFWDVVHVDTTGGMGAIPGWPNWYVCLVPGFYEIDGCLDWSQQSTHGGAGAFGWITVAEAAAQQLAAGTANPVTAVSYVSPIGELQRINATSVNTMCNPSTRLYLGLGDMITLSAEQNTGATIATGSGTQLGGSHLSFRFCGLGTVDDRVQMNSGINGGTVSNKKTTTFHTKSYNNTKTYTYYGASAPTWKDNTIHNTNGDVIQGTYKGGSKVDGSQYGQVVLPYGIMQGDLNDPGTTIDSATLKCHNKTTYYSSGGKLMVGACYSTPGENPWHPGANNKNTPDIVTESFNQGQTKTFTIPVRIIDDIVTGISGVQMKAYWIGNDSTTNLDYYGHWQGGANTWVTTVNWHVTI